MKVGLRATARVYDGLTVFGCAALGVVLFRNRSELHCFSILSHRFIQGNQEERLEEQVFFDREGGGKANQSVSLRSHDVGCGWSAWARSSGGNSEKSALFWHCARPPWMPH